MERLMNLVAKFALTQVIKVGNGRQIELNPVTGHPNEEWSKWTPSGKLTLFVANEALFEQIDAMKIGSDWRLTLSPFDAT